MAKNHKTAQPAFSTRQENALDLLVMGKSDTEVSDTVGVSRETVCRWRQNTIFACELNRRRQSRWDTASHRLRAMVPKALDVLDTRLDDGDKSAAIEVLKAVKLYGEVTPPNGHTDGMEAFKAQVQDIFVALDDLSPAQESTVSSLFRDAIKELDDPEPPKCKQKCSSCSCGQAEAA